MRTFVNVVLYCCTGALLFYALMFMFQKGVEAGEKYSRDIAVQLGHPDVAAAIKGLP